MLKELSKLDTVNPPKWLPDNVVYEGMMGSIAYGVSDNTSDIDIYGFGIPPKDMIFPHLAGEIQGFGSQKKRFEQYQQHHISYKEKEYDLTIYGIVKYFQLCMDNNPNMIDSLYIPQNCIIHITQIGQMVREERDIFLCKKAWHSFKGYAYAQLHKAKSKSPDIGSKRIALREKYGFDTKFMYHVARLMDEVEQILEHGTIDLQRSREYLKAIRRGEVSEKDVTDLFQEKEKSLETLYRNSKIPHKPQEAKIKSLLLRCLEHHFGSLDKCVHIVGRHEQAIQEIETILGKL